jgi:hypothetical protein
MGPDTLPTSYACVKVPLCMELVVDLEASYLAFAEQAGLVHAVDVTQRSEDPAFMRV